MAQQWDETNDDEQGGTDLVRDLRRQLKELSKRNGELEASLEKASKGARDRAVQEFVKSKGLDEKVAKLIPTNVEASEEALAGWLSEFGDVFGVKPAEGLAPSTEPGVPEQAVDSATREALSRVQQVAPAGQVSVPDLEQRIASAGSADELMAILRGA